MQHRVGDTLEGRYLILAELGRGGMGEVYLVENVRLRRREALKILRADAATDPRLAQRFVREGRAVGRLNHPNIVSVYDLGQLDDGTLFLTMEVVEGPTVAREVHRCGGLPVARARGILTQLTRAVHHAHERGVVHRDLKPDNLIVTRRASNSELVKVLDFGIAKIVAPDYVTTGLTAEGQLFGTPQYMPPEAFRGDPASGSSDLYAIGCIAYELVVGRPPFEGTLLQITVAHLSQRAPEPSASCPQLPEQYDALVARCMAKEPAQRYPSTTELLEALDRIPDPDAEARRQTLIAPALAQALAVHSRPPEVEEGTEERTFADQSSRALDSLAQTAMLSAEDLAPVHRTTVRELCELLLELNRDNARLQLRALFTELSEAERESARIDAELAQLDEATLQVEEEFRAREIALRAEMNQLRDGAEETGAGSSTLQGVLDAVERRIAEFWAEAEDRSGKLSEQLIGLTAGRATVEDRIVALYGRLSTAAHDVLPKFAQHPKIAPVAARLQNLNQLIQRVSGGRS